jgi:tetratricopeptide (TPR) repeat protein
MLRQLKVDAFRVGPRGARDQNALVIGDTLIGTASNLPELPGAQREAQEVAEQLARHGYRAEPLIRQPSLDIIRQLFARDYRIMHLAGHGIYNPEHPEKSGMVLGPDQFLTSLELGQVRNLPEFVFINCCYLARIDSPPPLDKPHKQAASVAQELIQMGVKAVVAAGWAVNDAAGLVFARSFYQSMLGGLKFGESVKRARQETHALGANNTWGAYQCYGNPDFALTPQPGSQSWPKRAFYSRRECLDELRDLAAKATGAPADRVKSLAESVAELDRLLISSWRDGESLSALAEAFKSLGNFGAALEAYDEALRDGKSRASVQTIESHANLKDRHAARLFKKDPGAARQLWEDAERRLLGLNAVLGDSSERLSLLAANCKRRGTVAEGAERGKYFQAAAEFYQKAYQHTKKTESSIDLYSGLNAVALSYVAGVPSDIAEECLKFAARQKDYPDFWARVYRPDALLLEHLRAGSLDSQADAVIQAYKEAFQHGTPHERDSALGQLRFLRDAAPAKDGPALQRVLDGVS